VPEELNEIIERREFDVVVSTACDALTELDLVGSEDDVG
jgi:hypothetical protein